MPPRRPIGAVPLAARHGTSGQSCHSPGAAVQLRRTVRDAAGSSYFGDQNPARPSPTRRTLAVLASAIQIVAGTGLFSSRASVG